jgi:hypothetical protein
MCVSNIFFIQEKINIKNKIKEKRKNHGKTKKNTLHFLYRIFLLGGGVQK